MLLSYVGLAASLVALGPGNIRHRCTHAMLVEVSVSLYLNFGFQTMSSYFTSLWP